MTTLLPDCPVTPSAVAAAASAILASACDGYAAGTTGRVTGRHQGCLVFTPDAPERVARWTRPRSRLLVPPAFVATLAAA